MLLLGLVAALDLGGGLVSRSSGASGDEASSRSQAAVEQQSGVGKWATVLAEGVATSWGNGRIVLESMDTPLTPGAPDQDGDLDASVLGNAIGLDHGNLKWVLAAFVILSVASLCLLGMAFTQPPAVAEERQVKHEYSLFEIMVLTLPFLAFGFTFCQYIVAVPLEVAHLTPYVVSEKGEKIRPYAVTAAIFYASVSLCELWGPCAGYLSDKHRSRYGRRRPFIACGTICASAATMGMWLSSGYDNVYCYGMCLVAQAIAWAFVHPTYLGLIVDVVADEQFDLASTCNGAYFATGCLGSFLISWYVGKMYYWQYIMSTSLTLLGCMGCCAMGPEKPMAVQPDDTPPGLWGKFKHFYWLDVAKYPYFATILFAKGMMYGISVSKGYLVYFVRDIFDVTDPDKLTSKVSMIALHAEGAACLIAFGLMAWSKSKGGLDARLVAVIGAALTGVGWIVLMPAGFFGGTYDYLQYLSLVYGVGHGLALVGDQALMLKHIPSQEHGSRFTSLQNVVACVAGFTFSVLDGTVVQLLGKELHNWQDGAWELPLAHRIPVTHEGYRLEGFLGLFTLTALTSFTWSYLYSRVPSERKAELPGAGVDKTPLRTAE